MDINPILESRRKALELLRVARCPDLHCDGYGTTVQMVDVTVAACCRSLLGDGSCCGNAVPELSQEPAPAPCQWCHERAELLGDETLLQLPAPERGTLDGDSF